MSTAYFAPAFSVSINQTSLAADVSRYITDVTYTSELNAIDSFSLTLANPYPRLRWTHTTDADLFIEGGSVAIEMGYVDDLRLMIDGEITDVSPTFPEGAAPTLRLEGRSRMHWLQRGTKDRTFRDMTDKQIVETIAADIGLTPQAEATQPSYPQVDKRSQTDLEFLLNRAKLIGFELLVEGKTLIFRKAQVRQGAICTFVWGAPGRDVGGAQHVLPLRSFSPSIDTKSQVSVVIVRGYDPQTKQEIVGRAGAGDEEAVMGSQTGAQAVERAFGAARQAVCVSEPVASQEEADQRARALYNERARQFVTGTGTSIGFPDLRAGHKVEMLGLGQRFSGPYYLRQVVHSLGASGYQMTFRVERNATG